MSYTYKKCANFTDPITGKEVVNEEIRRKEDGWLIPPDPHNRMYQEYQLWLAEGNTPEEAD